MNPPTALPGWYSDPMGGQRYWDGAQWSQIPPPQIQPVVINNTMMSAPPVFIRSGPNHALHLILTLLSCGLWLPIWIIVTVIDVASRPQTNRGGGRTVLMVLGGLFLIGMAAAHWQTFLGLAVLGGLGYVGYLVYERRDAERVHQAQLAARADQAYRSDPPGFLYPPTVFPQPKNRHVKDEGEGESI